MSRSAPARCAALPGAVRGGLRGLGKTDAILAAAAAHHRLAWIHPFLDGNGRVARLMSHAMLLRPSTRAASGRSRAGSRAMSPTTKSLLADCDLPRRNDLDGRGELSEEALADFTRFFLNLHRPGRLHGRASSARPPAGASCSGPKRKSGSAHCPRSRGGAGGGALRGELPRGEVEAIAGTGKAGTPDCGCAG